MATLIYRSAIVACLSAFLARAQQQPPIPVWNPDSQVSRDGRVFLSGDMHSVVVVVTDESGKDKIVRVPLWNDVAPSLTESVEGRGGPNLRYSFSVSNGVGARDSIGAWSLVAPPGSSPIIISPRGGGRNWGGSAAHAIVAEQEALGSKERGRFLAWFHHDDVAPIRPGSSLGGFAIETTDLPGFTTAWFSSGKLVEFDQSWPAEIFHGLEKLEDRRWREVCLVVVGPTLRATDSRETKVENFRLGLQAWLRSGQLRSDSPFVSELVALLKSSPVLSGNDRLKSAPADESERLIAHSIHLSLNIEPESAGNSGR